MQNYIKLINTPTVIYFKSAGLFRVYQSTDLEHYFVNRAKTNYRGQRAIYEVVNDDRPQKIVIIIDSRDKTELSKIKQYILDFSKEIDVEMSAEDLIVFDNSSDDTYEIVVKSWIVSNANDKNTRIQKLLQYIAREEKSAILSNKMTKMNYSDIPNTSMITAPGIKKLLSPFAKELDGFVSNTSGNVYIVINNGTIVNGDNTTNNFNATPDVGDDFIQYLESAEFDWYEPGKTVEYEMLYAEYVSNIKNISRRRFTGLYKGVLFSKITKTTLNNEYVRYVTFI